jgi:hypothetical protein
MTGYDAYQLFLALKQHFTSSYDFFKYNGKVKTSVDSFEKRKDCYNFRKLANLGNCQERVVAALINDITWIKPIVSVEGVKVYNDYIKIGQAFSHAFKTFLDAFKTRDVVKLLLPREGNEFPDLAERVIDGEIPLQFIIALDDLLGFLKIWDSKLEPMLWDPFKFKIAKFRPFFVYDKAKVKNIFLEWARGN